MPLLKKIGKKTTTVIKPSVSLPTKRNKPSNELADYSILLYGAKKIGKTSLAAKFPDAYILAFEPGTKALKVFTSPVNSWEEFEGYLDLLESENHDFKTLVIDTIDIAYEMAFDYVCRKECIKHPQEANDFGETWKKISQTFRKAVLRCINLKSMGVIFVSHDTEKEIELRDGKKIDRVQPTMSKQAMSVVEALVDIICNYSYEDEKRILRIDGSQNMVAGCRLEDNFLRKGGDALTAGDRVVSISMGKTAREAYDNFISAFNNEQEVTDVTATPPASKLKLKKPLLSRKGE